MTHTVVLLDLTSSDRAEHLRQLLPPDFVLTHGTARGDEHLKEIIRDADFAISGQVGVSGDVLGAARKLKLLHKWGVGVDNIDTKAAKELGIKVARTTGSNAVPVAEFTIGLIIATLRFQALGHERLRQGNWMAFNQTPGATLCISGKTVGLIGFGAIGQAVAARLRGFDCTILYNKRSRLSAAEEAELGVTYATTDDLLAQSDIVCLHCPLTPETTNLIDTKALVAHEALGGADQRRARRRCRRGGPRTGAAGQDHSRRRDGRLFNRTAAARQRASDSSTTSS